MAVRFSSKEVREERDAILDKCKAMEAVAKDQKRPLTDDEQAEFKSLLAKHDAMKEDVELAEKYEKAVKESAASRAPITPVHQDLNVDGGDKKRKPTNVVVYQPGHSEEMKAELAEDWSKNQLAVGMWLAAVAGKDTEMAKRLQDVDCQVLVGSEFKHVLDAQTVDDLTKGGNLVPIALANRIMAVRDRTGIASMCADVYPMASEVDEVPVEGTGFTVYALQNATTTKTKATGGAGEAAEITKSEMVFSNVSLKANEKYILTEVSNKLLRGALPNVANRIAERIGYDLARQQDYEYVKGTGAPGTPNWAITGLVSSLGAAGIFTPAAGQSTWALLTAASFRAAVALLPDVYHDNAKWLMSRAFFSQAIQPLLQNNAQSQSDAASPSPQSFMGYPIVFTTHMPTSTAVNTVQALFGDFRTSSILGQREGLDIRTSQEYGFSRDTIGILGKHAYDINVYRGGDGSNPGGYVGLKTSAT